MYRIRILLAALFSAPLLLVATSLRADDPAHWERIQQQLEREARKLFAMVLTRLDPAPDRCGLAAEWSSYPVPFGVAATYLKHTALADLVPLESPTSVQQTLDPSSRMLQVFCDDDTVEAEHKTRVEELSSLKIEGRRSHPDPTRQRLVRREYTFPVFDNTYRTAIVVGTSYEYHWYVASDGNVRRGMEMDVTAYIYRKRDGRWHLLKRELLATGHG